MNDANVMADASNAERGIAGDRGRAVVARGFSLQAKVQNALALGVVALVGGGFLAWYYSGVAETRAAVKQTATPAQVQGEMQLPPLGPAPPKVRPVEPTPLVEEGSAEAEALLAASGPAGSTYPVMPEGTMSNAPPPVDPVLQRRLEAPVLVRGVGGYAEAVEREEDFGADVLVDERGLDGPGPAAGRPRSGLAADGSVGGAASTELGGLLKPTVVATAVAGVLPERRFLLSKGAFIDCTLETAIDSTLPGMTSCVIATDVWSADGSVVLLERGTKLIGETRGGVRQGQRRLFVLWNEARTPAGVAVELGSPGTDALGRAGVTGEVDTQFAARFGAAILISLIDAAAAAVVAAQSDGGSNVVVSSGGAQDVMTEVLRETVGIGPVIRITQGERVSVMVARDVSFEQVYALADR